MLDRKQSSRDKQILSDYGSKVCVNENADIEWFNKVSIVNFQQQQLKNDTIDNYFS